MAKGKGIISKLRNLFRKKPESSLPTMPGLAGKRPGKVVGHRGVATGLLPDTGQWETIGGQEAEEFVYKGRVLKVHSSNVNSVMYSIEQKKLTMAFHSGGVYEYGNVSEQEAINFVQALSKGKFVWDYLRVRGSRTAHKKPYRKIG